MAAKSKSKKISKKPVPTKKTAAKSKPAPKQAISKKSIKGAIAKAKKTATKAIKGAAPKAKAKAKSAVKAIKSKVSAKATSTFKAVKAAAPKKAAVKQVAAKAVQAIKAKAPKASPKNDLSKHLGRFMWWELLTTDIQASTDFYSSVFGWKTKSSDMGDGNEYVHLTASGLEFGGITASQTPGTHWMPCVAVADIDETVTAARGLSAKILAGPMPIPGTGRYAVIGDPVGGSISVLQPEKAPALDPAAKRKPTQIDWTELITNELDKGGEFYAQLFNWNRSTMPMGELGEYHMFNQGDAPAAGMTQAPPESGLESGWLSYVTVPNIEATLAKAEKAGATVKLPITPAPGIGQMAIFADPLGGVIGLVQPEKK
jgi:predicted enzyme related to lactoylglutathione lyase